MSEAERCLSPEARDALARARAMPMSYGVRMYTCPGHSPRVLVVLGEAHMKLSRAEQVGREVVRCFELRGVETFQRRNVFLGRLLGVLIMAPRRLVQILSLGHLKGSTITEAKLLTNGHTVEVEQSAHVPLGLHVASVYWSFFFLVAFAHLGFVALYSLSNHLLVFATWTTYLLGLLELHMVLLVPALLFRRRSWSWIVHPALGLITARDVLMAAGTARMLAEHNAVSALLIVGRAHLPGVERELVERFGFSRLSSPP